MKTLFTSISLLFPFDSNACSAVQFLQRLMGGVIAAVLRPRESQCPLVRCMARELLTCLVMQPVMNLASPA